MIQIHSRHSRLILQFEAFKIRETKKIFFNL